MKNIYVISMIFGLALTDTALAKPQLCFVATREHKSSHGSSPGDPVSDYSGTSEQKDKGNGDQALCDQKRQEANELHAKGDQKSSNFHLAPVRGAEGSKKCKAEVGKPFDEGKGDLCCCEETAGNAEVVSGNPVGN